MNEFPWFALKSVPHVGTMTFRRLLEHFGSPERVLSATEQELSAVRGISGAAIASLLEHDPREAAEKECAAIRRAGVNIVTLHSPEYPALLLRIPDPPPYLYVRGELRCSEMSIAVIGSRRATGYGLATTEKMARELARNGIAVVSGMARGVDTAAHRGALAEGGRSIGVLGCGIDLVYPVQNHTLFAEMAEKGALVSEFPMGTSPLAENFPRRNRIISGLCRGVLVVEAAEGSGSLITAQCALEQGRDVYAIPGNIHSCNSRGTNSLIKQGAKLVERVEDILEDLPLRARQQQHAPAPPAFIFSPQEAAVYSTLSAAPLHIDDIVTKCALTVAEVSAILLRLELQGIITQSAGKHFQIA
jgi:DNA processing protein